MTYQTRSTVIIIGSVLLFIASIGVALGLIWPALIDLDSAKQEKAQKEEEKLAKQNLVETVKALLSQYQSLNSNVLANINRAVPLGQNIPDFLIQIENTAAESNLVVESTDFSPFQLQGGAAKIKALLASLVLKGDYPAFQQWLKLLESNLRPFDIRSIDFNLSSLLEKSIFTLKIKFLVYYQ